MCSSSDGNFAGVRCLNHLRAVLSHIGMEVISPHVSVPRAQEAFDDNGEFKEERLRKAMTQVCRTLIEHADWLSMRGGGREGRDLAAAKRQAHRGGARPRLIVGLDVPTRRRSRRPSSASSTASCRFYKIGYQLAFAGGLDFARELAAAARRSSST